jgi:hypothetical protein
MSKPEDVERADALIAKYRDCFPDVLDEWPKDAPMPAFPGIVTRLGLAAELAASYAAVRAEERAEERARNIRIAERSISDEATRRKVVGRMRANAAAIRRDET